MAAFGSAIPRSSARHSTFTVDFEIDAEDAVEALFRFVNALGTPNLARFLEEDVTEFYHDDIESRFNEEGDMKSGFWKELTDTTVRIRRSQGYPGREPINIRSGALFDFLMEDYDVIIGADFVELDVPGRARNPLTQKKLETAQQGSDNNPAGFGPTPPRPVLALGERDLMTILRLLEVYVVREALLAI